jgi:hypothetical protein
MSGSGSLRKNRTINEDRNYAGTNQSRSSSGSANGTYIFRNRHRFFDQDSNVDNDIPAVRKVRIEVVMIPWLGLTTLLIILLINLWCA